MKIRGYEITAGADLRGAFLAHADITHADFSGAKLDPGALLDCEITEYSCAQAGY